MFVLLFACVVVVCVFVLLCAVVRYLCLRMCKLLLLLLLSLFLIMIIVGNLEMWRFPRCANPMLHENDYFAPCIGKTHKPQIEFRVVVIFFNPLWGFHPAQIYIYIYIYISFYHMINLEFAPYPL